MKQLSVNPGITPLLIIIMTIVALMAVIFLANGTKKDTATAEATDYDACIAAGGTTYEGYDGVCMDADGNYTYSEDYYSDTSTTTATDTTTETSTD